MHIIFDRSAFHGELFDLLYKSSLLDFVRTNKIRVSHTQIFLEETIRMYGNIETRFELKRQLPFILDICNAGYFHSKETIWIDELIHGHGAYANVYWGAADKQYVEKVLRENILLKDEEWKDWRPIIWDDMEAKKNRQKNVYREVRAELPEILRKKGHTKPLKSLSFPEYLNLMLDETGRHLIKTKIKSKNNQKLQENWSLNKSGYPFITAFTKGFLYAGYYAAIEQNRKLDRNAQADYELMTYLECADAVVSADQGFFKSAFTELWLPGGKKLFTPQEFLLFIQRF